MRGPFTSWYCHQEMHTAIKEGKPIIGVMEIERERNAPDFALERERCMGVSEHSEEVVKLLDEVRCTGCLAQRQP